MVYLLDYYSHVRDCKSKQAERAKRIESLSSYNTPLSSSDRDILDKPVSELVEAVHAKSIQPQSILQAYGKAALRAHQKTNCLTEILISSSEKWVEDGSINLNGPLAGIPISLKDSVALAGFDTTIGYSSNVGNKKEVDGTLARLLKDAGAVPYVKTNLPITLLSFESTNDVWGQTTNPHNNKYSPGGSTGGESALLAAGGGRIGIGSDVAGSVRVPAHWSGIYSLRCSTGRWPKSGVVTSTLGQEGIPSVFSPMTRTLPDLTYFTKSMIGMKPWKYDHSVHPIAWRGDVFEEYSDKKKFKVGVMRSDGVVDPSPACARAVDMVVDALRKEGHEVVDVNPPSPYEALPIASQLLNADGCRTFSSFFRTFEWNDKGSAQMAFLMSLPAPVRYVYWAWVKYVRKDEIWAGVVRDWREKTVEEQWKLVARRELYKVQWHEWWEKEAKIDFLITTPNATPAVPHGGMADACASCGYTFLFNLLDYTAGVMPITHVDKSVDQLPADFKIRKLNGVAQGAYKHYDATAMHGLPVGVQVVGQRLEEEKVLAVMERIESAIGDDKYQLLEID